MSGSSKPKPKPAPAPPKVTPVPTTPPQTYTATFYLTDGTTEVQSGLTANGLATVLAVAGAGWGQPANDAAGPFYGSSGMYSFGSVNINLNQVTKIKTG